MTITDAEPTSTPFWMTNGHPSWCWVSHGPGDHPDDRWHASGGETIDATLEQGVSCVGEYLPTKLSVHLWQHEGEAAPHVRISYLDDDPWVKLTVTEVRELAGALMRIADLADGEVGRPRDVTKERGKVSR